MKKVYISFLLLLFCIAQLAAQSDSQISQHTFFSSAFNPAAVGQSGMIQAIAMNRMDFFTMENGVNTTNVGVNMPFTMGGISHGAGIRFVNKTSGSLWTYQHAYLQYAFVRSTPIGNFRLGVDFGFVSSQIDGSQAIARPEIPGGDGDDFHQDDDPRVPRVMISGMKFDIGFGMMYTFNRGYVGLSMTNATRPTIVLDGDGVGDLVWNDTIQPALHLHGAYSIRIPDTNWTLKPHSLMRTNFIVHELGVGALMIFDERFWGGLSTRFGITAGGMAGFNTFGVTAGMNIAGGLSAGIAYDLPTSRLIHSVGSAELFIAYNFEFVRNRHNRRHKSIRIL